VVTLLRIVFHLYRTKPAEWKESVQTGQDDLGKWRSDGGRGWSYGSSGGLEDGTYAAVELLFEHGPGCQGWATAVTQPYRKLRTAVTRPPQRAALPASITPGGGEEPTYDQAPGHHGRRRDEPPHVAPSRIQILA
jgi:hypothetical protein